jgi:hypothetical protein
MLHLLSPPSDELCTSEPYPPCVDDSENFELLSSTDALEPAAQVKKQ